MKPDEDDDDGDKTDSDDEGEDMTMMMAPNLWTRGGLQKQHLLLICSMRPKKCASSQPFVFQLMSR